MSAELTTANCPVCYSAGTVAGGRCQLCEAEFGDDPGGAVDLPPAAPPGSRQLEGEPAPLRFSDVIAELQQVGSLVSSADGALELEAACGRLQMLLHALRVQFLSDVVLKDSPVASAQPKRPVT